MQLLTKFSFLTCTLFSIHAHAANPLRQRAAFAARAAVARTAHQPARVVSVASSHVHARQLRIVKPPLSRAALYTDTYEQPSLEKCAEMLPILLKEKGRLDSLGEDCLDMELEDWKKRWNTNQEQIERYRQPILEHLEAKKRRLAEQKDNLVRLQVILETQPHRLVDDLEDLIK